MTRRSVRSHPLAWVAAVIVLAAIGAAAYGGWYLFLRPAGPAPVSIADVPLPTASARPGSAATPLTPGTASAQAASAPSAPSPTVSGTRAAAASDASGLDGTWVVNTSLGSFSDFSDSFVGYRVEEQLGSIGANTAVGRTPKVSGTMTIQGTTVTAVDVTADLTALQSDDQRRDGQLRRQGIQTATYPTATFALTSPMDLGSIPSDGQSINATATGQLTLHGQTRTVTVSLQAKRSGGVIAVTGSLPITFADYGITKPSSFLVVSIADGGTMEFQLLFTRQ